MNKFLLSLCLVGCLSMIFAACLQAAEKAKAEMAVVQSQENKEISANAGVDDWFEAETDSNKNVPSGDITILPPSPSEIINSGLSEVSAVAGLISTDKTAITKPECGNPRLLDKVLARIATFYKQNQVNNIIDQRRQVLMLKNLKDFKEVDIASFNPKENYTVSDQIIAYKINKGIKEKEMRLCRSSLPRAIYLLIYPQNSLYTVEIINFPGMPNSKDFTAVYD